MADKKIAQAKVSKQPRNRPAAGKRSTAIPEPLIMGINESISPDSYRKQEEAYMQQESDRMKNMVNVMVKEFEGVLPGLRDAIRKPTLSDCIMESFPAVIRRSAGSDEELADRAISLGTALYKKLQAL